MGREIEPHGHYKRQDIFTNPEKRVIEAWAYGPCITEDVAAYLGVLDKTASHYATNIKNKMTGGKGTDFCAKAVTFAALKGWIDPMPFPDNLDRNLTKREHLILTQRAIGLTREEVSREFKIPESDVVGDLEAMQSLIGCDTDYGVIAWAILKGVKDKAKLA